MDLRQLRYLVAVADEGGFRAAARRLRRTQPQISQAVRNLEHELGVQLLQRTPQGTSLTDAGRHLVARARQIVHQVADAEASTKALAGPGPPLLRVGLLAGVLSAGELLAPILAEHRRRHPEVLVELRNLVFDEQLTGLLDASVDVVITRAPLADPGVAIEPLAFEPRVLLVGAMHELADAPEVDIAVAVRFCTVPTDAPKGWAAFWQLDAERGRPNAVSVPAVRTVPDSQLIVANYGAVISGPASMTRFASNPLLRSPLLHGASPSLIALATRRGDRRRIVRDFASSAHEATAGHIALLPGGVIAP